MVASLLMVGLAGCDLFNPEDIPPVCESGFELQGTECVPIETEGDVPVITLTGDATIYVATGDAYVDQGATATDTEDGNLTADIVVGNTVNVNTPGTYTVTYDVTDSDGQAATTVTRTVIVVEPGDNDPSISLIGNAIVTLNAGDAYNDQGATATDLEDGNLTSAIVVTGTVNTAVAGVYVITYSVTDDDNNTVSVTRTVTVLPSDAEVLANYIVDNWDGSLAFLGLTMANMDFSTAMNLSVEVDFEITQNETDVHFIHAMVTDQFLYEETGDTMHREIMLDIDGEMQLTLNMIFQEVETGVHVYIEYRPILEMIASQDPGTIDMLGWVGFDDQWALFELDDSLETVVEVAVIKDMIVSLFFSEMGEMFFYDTQEEVIEEAIGFDLTQYGVDLGAFIDLLIEEDFVAAEAMLQNIQAENILLHIDHMYIAWQLHDFFLEYETELLNDGFDTSKLDLLDTATYNETTEEMEVNMPIDPLDGTQAFFESLTELELESIVEVIIKPAFEMMVYGGLTEDLNPEWLEYDFEMMLTDFADFLEENWPQESAPFVLQDELDELALNGAIAYWYNLTWDEQSIFWWAIDHHNTGWSVWQLDDYLDRQHEFRPELRRYGMEVDIYMLEGNITGLINSNVQYLLDNHSGFDATIWLQAIEDMGVIRWFAELTPEERDMVGEIYNLPGMEMFGGSVDELSWLAERPWEYQFFYEGYGNTLGVDHATWTIEDLLMRHESYLTDEYSYDVGALIQEINGYDHKVVEWYRDYATQDQRDHLWEIADFEYEDHIFWTLETLDDIYYSPYDYYVFYGRAEERYDTQYLEDEISWLLNDYHDYVFDTYGIDTNDWANDIYYGGVINWYNNLSEADRNILSEISLMDDMWYRWSVELLEMYNEHPENYSYGMCNWDYCFEDEWVQEDLINLLENNAGFLMDEGYDVTYLVSTIESVGVLEWYTFYTDGYLMDLLHEMAEWGQWRYDILYTIEDLVRSEEDLLDFLYTHETELNAIGFDATQKIADLEMYGLQVFVADYLSEADIELLMDTYLYPEIDALFAAIDDGEVPEFLIATFFGNPHVQLLLDEIENMEDFPLDMILEFDSLEANLLALDFDALIMETVDLEALLTAIYEGPTAYETFMQGLELTAPNSELILSLFTPAVAELQPLMVFVDDFNYAMDGLSVFEHYFTPEYWLDDSGMDIDLDVTDELYVETTMVMDPIMYQVVADDLFADINTFLSGFQTLPFPYDVNWECIDGIDDDCDDLELDNLMAMLTQFGDIQVNMTFDPSDPTWMQLQLDVTDFLDVIVDEAYTRMMDDPYYEPNEYDDVWTAVNNATITVTMSEGGAVVMPADADVDNVNEIAYEGGKSAIAMFARDYLRELVWHYEMNPTELADLILAGPATYSVSEFYFIRTTQAFDNDMSTIGVTIDMSNPLDPKAEFSLTLYWIDGTEALDGSVSLAEFMVLFNDSNDLIGQAAYDTMVGFVNADNYNMTKLWLMLVLQEDDYYRDDYYNNDFR